MQRITTDCGLVNIETEQRICCAKFMEYLFIFYVMPLFCMCIIAKCFTRLQETLLEDGHNHWPTMDKLTTIEENSSTIH